MDIGSVFSRWAAESPKDVFIVKGDRQLTPGFIWSQASCLATGFISLGLAPGEGVAVWMHSAPETVVTFLAIQLAGGCYVPIPPSMEDDKASTLIGSCRVAMAITSLSLYDRYSHIENNLAGVRQLIVDAGETEAETTLPANARTLTPLLMIGRDVTLPDIEPGMRSICFGPQEEGGLVEVYRREGGWGEVVEKAAAVFHKGCAVLNAMELVRPEALIIGAIWPLLAGGTVFIPGGTHGSELMSNRYDVAIMDANSAELLGGAVAELQTDKILWSGPGIKEKGIDIAKGIGASIQSLSGVSKNFGIP